MKPNELRIGNYVSYYGNGKPFEIEGMNTLNKKSWKEGYVISRNEADKTAFHALEPIPLTEEWLLKFGFKKHHSDYYNDILMLKITPSTEHEYIFKLFPYELGSAIQGRTQRIYFVHQLQNLYFALTGEELTNKN